MITLVFAAIGILLFSVDSRVGVTLDEVDAASADASNKSGPQAFGDPAKSNGH